MMSKFKTLDKCKLFQNERKEKIKKFIFRQKPLFFYHILYFLIKKIQYQSDYLFNLVNTFSI